MSSKTVRYDAHSRDVFIVDEYVMHGVMDFDSPSPKILEAINALVAQGYSRFSLQSDGKCAVRGTRVRFGILLSHKPTQEFIFVSPKALEGSLTMTFNAESLIQKAKEDAKRQKAASLLQFKIAASCDDNPLLADLTYPELIAKAGYFVKDVAERFLQYGSLSEAQVRAVEKSLRKYYERVQEQEKFRKHQEETAEALPQGADNLLVVQGTIQSVSARADYFNGGTVWKMKVLDTCGFVVWGTVPAKLIKEQGHDVDVQTLVGRKVNFHARVTRSDKDRFFGFAKRITQARFTD